MTPPIRIGLVGVGKIARDQHLPALRGSADFALTALVSHEDHTAMAPTYATLARMLDADPDIEAVSICTPPQVRYGLAAEALARGLHVFLEKPPGATLSEVEALSGQALQTGRTLLASWHSRFAPAVGAARAWLADRQIRRVQIDWREDVRKWHPGQMWIWQAGGLGVFDPGINALSIATSILPHPFFLSEAELRFPSNLDAPVAADLRFHDVTGVEIVAGFDFLQTGPQTWDIRVETDQGQLLLSQGGCVLAIDGQVTTEGAEAEYPGLYKHFAELIRHGQSDVDVAPLRHVADAFLRGRRVVSEPLNNL